MCNSRHILKNMSGIIYCLFIFSVVFLVNCNEMECFGIPVLVRHMEQTDSRAHQEAAGIYFSGLLQPVIAIRIKTLEPQEEIPFPLRKFDQHREQRFRSFGIHELPCHLIGIIPWRNHALKIAEMNQVVILMVIRDLRPDLGAGFFTDFRRIQLIPEGTPHRDVALCFVRRTV